MEAKHTKDADCTRLEDGECLDCHAWGSALCAQCGGVRYHTPDCPETSVQDAINAALQMDSILDTRDALLSEYSRLFEAVIAEEDPAERKRLAYAMDEVVGARLGHKMANGPAFMEAARRFAAMG